jgi:predicted RNase H-like HicB family nuclease
MREQKYPAIFTLFDDGYTVTFPDLPGCVTQGDDIAEAVQMAAEAASLYLHDMDSMPEPLDIESVREFYAAEDDLVYNIKVTVDENVITLDSLKTWVKEFGYRLVKDNPMPKLKKCVVCGGRPERWIGPDGIFYQCKECGRKSQARHRKRDAIDMWNARTVQDNDAT